MSTAFYRPTDTLEAISLLGRFGKRAIIVNGGTDIVIEISKGRLTPEAIISISDIQELHEISHQNGYIRIGGSATYYEMMENPLLNHFSGMIEAISQVGSPAIRQVATLAGNICTAAPAPDGCTMAMGLDAVVVLAGPSGERLLPLSQMLLGRGKTAREEHELLTAILLPISKKNCAYLRLARRRAQDIAKVMVGVSLELQDGVCKDAVISLGALNAVPCRAYSLEKLLKNNRIEEGIARVEEIFPQEAKPRPSPFREYKEQVLPTMIGRTLRKAAERWGTNEPENSILP
ncbi:FAD binding domain-containing protein [Yanshouia hominis]|uniref:FAD binding domain-containing protein n=1 Tax=Yanshouia hominis TaxID=2763673 RepID=A0ABR7NMT5_9FIRM|nr:FAD binding domain-containing protein [Yanshouia hominis]MBC8577733.1 FAD binding domain-containing protein [Yanshouia hominis]